jgi:hypothetical protein
MSSGRSNTSTALFDHRGRHNGVELAHFGRQQVRAGDDAAQKHPLPDEIGDEARRRLVIEVVSAVPLLDPALAHDADFVGERERFVLVVGDEYGRDARALDDVANLEGKALAQVDVQVRERLVEQQQVRFRRQRARQRHALLLASGKLVRIGVAYTGQTHQRQHRIDARARFGRWPPSEAEADIAGHGQVRKQRVILKDHANPTPLGGRHSAGRRNHVAGQSDAAGGDGLEAGNAAQHRGLAAPGGTEQAADLPFGKREVQAAHDAVCAVSVLESADVDRGCHGRECTLRKLRRDAVSDTVASAWRRAAAIELLQLVGHGGADETWGFDGRRNPPARSRSATRARAASNAPSSDLDRVRPCWNSASPKNVASLLCPHPNDVRSASDAVRTSVFSSFSASMNPPE